VTYCPYFGIDLPDSEPFSEEHILQCSLGGPSSLCISVSTKANSRLGTEVDSPLVNSFFITPHRLKHHLAGQSGSIPEIEMKGMLENLDIPVPVRYTYGIDGPKIWLKPTVEYNTGIDGQVSLQLGASSEEELLKIIGNVNRKHAKKGFNPIDPTQALLQSKRTHISQPSIQASMTFDATSFSRAFVKMALGFGHLVMGESYTRSDGAALLRKFMWEADPSVREGIPLHGQVFPFYNDENLKSMLSIQDHHVIGIIKGNPPCFFVSLFGKFTGVVALAEGLDDSVHHALPEDGIFWDIDPSTKTANSYSLSEFVYYKQTSNLPPFLSDGSQPA
jgi:hypothetical protein